MKILRLLCYTFTHFCVDFFCFYLLFLWYSSGLDSLQTVNLGFLFYNIIAFGLQPLIGYFYDNYQSLPLVVLSGLFLLFGYFTLPFPFLAIFFIGLGNAGFHIYGAVNVLYDSQNKLSGSGLFVSFGALGVAFGTLAGQSVSFPVYLPVVLIVFCMMLLLMVDKQHLSKKTNLTFAVVRPQLKFEVVLILAFLAIAIRSYAGFILPLSWRTTTFLFLLPAFGAFLGKAIGGVLCDIIGAKTTALFSLGIAILILPLYYNNPYLFFLGIIFFNMNMAITLGVMVNLLPENPGLAFGITTLALLCGNIPTFFIRLSLVSLVFTGLVFLSLICLAFILQSDRVN